MITIGRTKWVNGWHGEILPWSEDDALHVVAQARSLVVEIDARRETCTCGGEVVWRDNLDENGAAIRMRSGGRGKSWSRRTRSDASPL
jgi:hypothetical protein